MITNTYIYFVYDFDMHFCPNDHTRYHHFYLYSDPYSLCLLLLIVWFIGVCIQLEHVCCVMDLYTLQQMPAMRISSTNSTVSTWHVTQLADAGHLNRPPSICYLNTQLLTMKDKNLRSRCNQPEWTGRVIQSSWPDPRSCFRS